MTDAAMVHILKEIATELSDIRKELHALNDSKSAELKADMLSPEQKAFIEAAEETYQAHLLKEQQKRDSSGYRRYQFEFFESLVEFSLSHGFTSFQ